VDQITPHYVIVTLASPAHNWFAGTFTDLPTDKDVTIGLSMAGNDTRGNAADVTKWVGLMPVMTYADPTQYETYEWFAKNKEGRWVSGDPFKQGEAKFAGTGKVPTQTVIPKDVAEQFLSKDGTYWQPWREVDTVEAVPGINIFRITQQYAYPTATVAMRVPFTYTYLCQFITRLKTAKFPGIVIDVVVKSKEGREIYAIRYTDRKNHVLDQAAIQTILIYARELSNVKYHMLKNDGTETSIPGTDKYLVTVPILYLREPQSAIPIYKRGFGLKRDWQQEMVFLYTKYYKGRSI